MLSSTINEAIVQYCEAYQDILPDPQGFRATVQTPAPRCVWANPLKIDCQVLHDELCASGFSVEPIDWYPGAFRLSPTDRVAHHWSYATGLCHIQEEVSLLPVHCVGVQPGDHLLDLCAAPGNKSVQAAVRMRQTGSVMAHDVSVSRMRAIGHAMQRLGVINLTTMVGDGCVFPGPDGLFDKVLVDAPCSCEGTLRKQLRRSTPVVPHAARSRRIAIQQLSLLKRAWQLCRPGGRIVYSTCTFSPIENESVVADILRIADGDLRLCPVRVLGFKSSPGVCEWGGVFFGEKLQHCLRVWPHQNNTGGFFVAILEKRASVSAEMAGPAASVQSEQLSAEDQEIVSAVADRFGLGDLFDRYRFVRRSVRGLWVQNVAGLCQKDWRTDSEGLFAIKTEKQAPKLSTEWGMCVAPYARRHVITLSREQCAAYLSRQDVIMHADQLGQCETSGYVLLCYDGIGLGVGFYRLQTEQSPALLLSLFPKRFALTEQ